MLKSSGRTKSRLQSAGRRVALVEHQVIYTVRIINLQRIETFVWREKPRLLITQFSHQKALGPLPSEENEWPRSFHHALPSSEGSARIKQLKEFKP